MWYLDDLFELLAFVVVLWAWKINGARRWCESEKVSGTTSSFDHGVMKGLSEGSKCGDYGQA